MPSTDRNVLHEVQRQRRLSLRRPRRQNQQFGRLQSRRELVQFDVARGNPRDALPFLKNSFQALEVVADDVLDRQQSHAHAVFGQRKNRRLRAIQNRVRAVLALERSLLNVVRGVNQVAQDRLLFDDPRVVLDVRNLRHAVRQRRQVRRAPGRFQVPLAIQLLGQRHQVDRLLHLAQRDHLREHAPVLVQKKIFRPQMLDRRIQRIVIQQNRAEYRTFGIQVIR